MTSPEMTPAPIPLLTARDRVRILVLNLTNWTWEERLRALQSRDLRCKRNMTEREGRVARREIAQWLKNSVARFNPMIANGSFAKMEFDRYERRVSTDPIDVLIDHANYGSAYDNCGNRVPLTLPELFRTKEPWGYCVPLKELEPREWEGTF